MTLSTAGRHLGAPLLVSVVVGVVFCFPPLTAILEFERSAMAHGEWWRWLTGHFTHWSFEHLLWDVLAFGVLASLCERHNRVAARTCVLVSAMAISAGLWLLRPDIVAYRGLSGVNAALFVFLAVTLAHQQRGYRGLATLSLLGFAAKIGYEALFRQSFFMSEIDAAALVPLAHILGSLSGAAVAIGLSRLVSFRSRRAPPATAARIHIERSGLGASP